MATVPELTSLVSDLDRKLKNATGQLAVQQENLKRQQDVQKYNLVEAAKYEAIAAAAAPESAEQISATSSAIKQRANAAAIQNNIDSAQQEVTGWQSQIDTFTASLETARSNLETAKIAQEETKKTAEDTKETAAPAATDPTKAPPTADGDKTGDSTTTSGLPPTPSSNTTANNTPNAGTTIAGKAGNSKTADIASLIGRRDYNPLGDFSSYTYKIALYMMNPDEFNSYMEGDYTKLSSFKLIAQSGGITAGVDSARATGFDLDLYIDDLEIDTLVNSKETLSATNSIEFKFKIYEPYGFSFPHKLAQAQLAASKLRAESATKSSQTRQINALTENFLLTVKFYGYDKDGKLVSSSDYPQADINKSETQSVFERGFPIKITGLKFALENKMTVYSIAAVQNSEQVAKGTRLGGVPTNITLAGETVRDVLVGTAQDTTKKSILGLVQVLNDLETELVKQNNYKYKNEYAIEFESSTTIGDARLVPKEYYVKERTPFTSIQSADGSNERTAWNNRLGIIEKGVRTVEIQAGTPIIQVIDKIITQSEYLKNMMTAVDKEIDQSIKETDSTVDKNPSPKTITWYNISTKSSIISPEKDPERNEYAYKITYIIQDYEIPYIRSLYASKTSTYYGPHKRYNYWYTGENSEILSYEQYYNFLYTVDAASASRAATKNTQSAAVAAKSAMNIDSDNSKSGTNDVVNSMKSYLYSLGDLMNFKLKILGDPDYLMPSIGNSGSNGIKKWYGDNLTINPNSGQIFIEIKFQQAEDYSNTDGLLVPNNDIQFMNYPAELKEKIKGMTYMLTKVKSSFSKGTFVQTLDGIIPEFTTSGDANSTIPPIAKNERQQDSTPASNSISSGSSDQTGAPSTESSTGETSNTVTASTRPDASAETTSSQVTSPTGGPSPSAPSTPPTPPALVIPNPSPTARTTFAGAMIKAYESGVTLVVPVFLPSGKELANVRGWGAAQWDPLIASADDRDLAALTSLKASYDTVIQPLITDVQDKIAANDAARKAHNELLTNWGKAAGTGSSSGNKAVADDDSGKS